MQLIFRALIILPFLALTACSGSSSSESAQVQTGQIEVDYTLACNGDAAMPTVTFSASGQGYSQQQSTTADANVSGSVLFTNVPVDTDISMSSKTLVTCQNGDVYGYALKPATIDVQQLEQTVLVKALPVLQSAILTVQDPGILLGGHSGVKHQASVNHQEALSSDYGQNGVYLAYPMVKVGTYSAVTVPVVSPVLKNDLVSTYDQYTLQKQSNIQSGPTIIFSGKTYPIYCSVPQMMNIDDAYAWIKTQSPALLGLPVLNMQNQLTKTVQSSSENSQQNVWLAQSNGWLPYLPGISDYVEFYPGALTEGSLASGWLWSKGVNGFQRGAYLNVAPYCGFQSNLNGLFVRHDGSVEVPVALNNTAPVMFEVVDNQSQQVVASYQATGVSQTQKLLLPLSSYRIRVLGTGILIQQGKPYQVSASLQHLSFSNDQTLVVSYQPLSTLPEPKVIPWVIQSWDQLNNPWTLLNLTNQPITALDQLPGVGLFKFENMVPPGQAGLLNIDRTKNASQSMAADIWLGFPGDPYYQAIMPDTAGGAEPDGSANKPFHLFAGYQQHHLTCQLQVNANNLAVLYPSPYQNKSYQTSLYVTDKNGQWTSVATIGMQWMSEQLQPGRHTWIASSPEGALLGTFVPQLIYPLSVNQIDPTAWNGTLTITTDPLASFTMRHVLSWSMQKYQNDWNVGLPQGYDSQGLGGAFGFNNQVGQVAYQYNASFTFSDVNPNNRCLIVTQPIGAGNN